MGIRDLFAAHADLISDTFGESGSITHTKPGVAAAELVGAVFSDTTESELQLTEGNKSADRIGVIDMIDPSVVLHPNDEFTIEGETWKYRGPGGVDHLSGKQSVLVRLPREIRHAAPRGK